MEYFIALFLGIFLIIIAYGFAIIDSLMTIPLSLLGTFCFWISYKEAENQEKVKK